MSTLAEITVRAQRGHVRTQMTDADIIAEATMAFRRFRSWQGGRTVNSLRTDDRPTPTASEVLDRSLDILGVPDYDREHQWAIWADAVIDAADNRTQRQPPRGM